MLAWPVLDGWDWMCLMKLVLQTWKSSQLGLNAAVGKNCPQGAETVPGEQEAEKSKALPRSSLSLWCPRGRAKHRQQSRTHGRVGLELSGSYLIAGT